LDGATYGRPDSSAQIAEQNDRFSERSSAIAGVLETPRRRGSKYPSKKTTFNLPARHE
jgi:hypothetical protein